MTRDALGLGLAVLYVPPMLMTNRVVTRVIELLPAALLAALVVVNAGGTDGRLVLDFRLAALAAVAIALWLRAPFIVVLIVAGGVGALGAVLTG